MYFMYMRAVLHNSRREAFFGPAPIFISTRPHHNNLRWTITLPRTEAALS